MRRFLIVLGGAFLAVTLLAESSMAQRSDPEKANKFQATLVTAYKQCVAPNDATAGSLVLPACHPAIRDDGTCTIGSGGGGKVQAKADKAGDVAIKIRLKGISGCDGETLQAVATLRLTTNACASADPNGCTVIDLVDFPLTGAGSCVITGGKCQIKTTFNTELGAGTLTAGDNTVIQLNGIALKRTTGVGSPGKVAVAGIGIP
jgi:hypothetical protein